METSKESIDVVVPVSTAYNQWTQFEEFPKFMEGVHSVQQIDDTHLRWVAEVGGERREWQAEIVEQVPDEKVAWRASGGKGPNGIVTFEPLGADTTLITVEMSYERLARRGPCWPAPPLTCTCQVLRRRSAGPGTHLREPR